MAASMCKLSKCFHQRIHPKYTINIYLRHKSIDVGLKLKHTNERNNPKESADQYFHPKKKQQKIRKGLRIEKDPKSFCGSTMKYLHEISGNHVYVVIRYIVMTPKFVRTLKLSPKFLRAAGSTFRILYDIIFYRNEISREETTATS
jgi:hypothetical protein